MVSLMRTSKEALGEMFDRFTVAEWIEQKLYPMYSRLSKLRQTADGLRGVSVWPSRSYLIIQAATGALYVMMHYILFIDNHFFIFSPSSIEHQCLLDITT